MTLVTPLHIEVASLFERRHALAGLFLPERRLRSLAGLWRRDRRVLALDWSNLPASPLSESRRAAECELASASFGALKLAMHFTRGTVP